MECSNPYIELTVTIGQLLFGFACFYFLKFWLGFLAIISTVIAFKVLTEIILKMHPLTVNDKILLSDNFFLTQSIFVQLDIENFNTQRIIEGLTNAFTQVPKLSYILAYKFFNFYWIKSNKTSTEILEQRIITQKPMTKDQTQEFIKTELHKELDPFITPVEFHIVPAAESIQNDGSYYNGYLYVKVKHSFTDGMGILILLSCMTDKFTPKIFPRVLSDRNPTLCNKIIEFLLFLLIGLPLILWVLISTKSAFKLSNMPRTRNVGFTQPLTIDLQMIKRKSKDLNMSINEICTLALLTAIKKYKPEAKKIHFEIPIALTPMPKSLSEVSLCNHVFALFHQMTLLEDPIKELKTFRNDYKALMRQAQIAKITDWGSYFLSLILPFSFAKKLSNDVIQTADLIMSNVPGPTELVEFNGNRIIAVIPYTTTGNLQNLFPIVSYNEKLKFVGIYDAGQDFDGEIVVKLFESSLNSFLQSDENEILNTSSPLEMKTSKQQQII